MVVTGSKGFSVRFGRDASCQNDDHRFADGARGGEQDGADNARQRCGQDDALDRFRLRGAEPVGTFPQRLRNRVDDVVRQRRDERDQHDAHDQAGSQHAGRGDRKADMSAEIAQTADRR